MFWKVYSVFLSTNSGSLFSILLLCKFINTACCIAMEIILLKVYLMEFLSILNISLMIFIEGMCIVALAPIVMTISDSTFHPLLVMLSMSNWYVLCIRIFGHKKIISSCLVD